ncbi:MAG: SIMPL domain-containing protein [Caldisericia bacterium]|nr:SIMPL domain-containing protein [Caldisericia bacterium]
MKQIWKVILLILVVVLFGWVGYTVAQTEETAIERPYASRVLSVSGSATMQIKPDMATITVGYMNEALDAGTAQSNNAEVMNAVIEALKKAGIEEKDMQTKNFSIQPLYQYEENKTPYIRGYQAIYWLGVTIYDTKRVGEIIDIAFKNKANQFQNVAFDVQNKDKMKLEGIDAAMKDARVKAEKALAVENETIKRIITVNVDGNYPTAYETNSSRQDSKVAPGVPQIMEGSLTYTVTVQVEYSF